MTTGRPHARQGARIVPSPPVPGLPTAGPRRRLAAALGWTTWATCAAGALLAVGCTRSRTGTPAPATSPALVKVDPAPAASAGDDDENPNLLADATQAPPIAEGPWRESLRGGRWAEAAARIRALPEAEQARPEVRLGLGYAASQLGDAPTVVKTLDGLDATLPVARGLIVRLRATALAKVGPYEEPAAYFARKKGTGAQLLAALAEEKLGHKEEARRAADRAVSQAHGTTEEAKARAIRARLAEETGDKATALADVAWIVRNAAGSAEDEPAQASWQRLDPAAKLTAREHLTRAERLAELSKGEPAGKEVDEAEATNAVTKEGLGKVDFLRAKGRAFYKARRFKGAHEVLTAAVAAGSKDPEDAFLAARALSRDNRDDEAIAAYRAFLKQSPDSEWADEATYLAARLAMLQGRWDEAVSGYEAYAKRFPKGKNKTDAAYERALSLLHTKKAASAQKTFEGLAAQTNDRVEAARLRELAGVAAERAGDPTKAKALYTDTVKGAPLTFPAMLASARLRQLGAPLPPVIEPGVPGNPTPLDARLPGAVAFLADLGLLAEAEDLLRRGEKELGKAFAPRSAEGLCALYGALDRGSRRFRIGSDAVKLDTLFRAPSASTRWAWECVYPHPYTESVQTAESAQKLPAGFIHAIMRQESAFSPEVVSPAHAVGLLQLLPTTAKSIADRTHTPFEEGSLTQPAVNITLGSQYMAFLSGIWRGNLALVAASYNAGPKAVSRWLRGSGVRELDLFVAQIPYGETRAYVGRVMGNFARYAYLTGGDGAVPTVSITIEDGLQAGDDAF
jgi:soluble lytic murein transglycosylase